MKDQIKKALDAARKEASEAYAILDAKRNEMLAGGLDVEGSKEAFEAIEPLHKNYVEKADRVTELQDQWERAVALEGVKAPSWGEDDPEEKTTLNAKTVESYGGKFVASDGYQQLVKSGVLQAGEIKLPSFLVEVMDRADALDMVQGKTLITGLSDTSAGAFVINQRFGGLIDLLRETPKVAALVASGSTDSDTVEWVEQSTRTNAAAETLEATSGSDGALPESALALVVRNTIVQEIGHFIPVTRRAMADAGQIRTIIDNELTDGILYRLDNQLLNGNGTTPNLKGILQTAGIATQAKGADSRVDAIHKAMTQLELAFLSANAVVMHPTDWQSVRLDKTANGDYYFGPPTGVGSKVLWGLPVVTTTLIAQGTALVGDFNASTLYLREGIAVAATEAHSDWFIRSIIAVKAQMRAAFGVQRPAAFCTVTGL